MNLSENFTLEEMTRSTTAKRKAIDNTPSVQQITNLQKLCVNVLERVRTLAGGKKVRSTSGFRCVKLNKLIGGAPTSQHTEGKADDFTIDDMTVTETVDMIRGSDIEFDQLIHEFDDWIHVSFNEGKNRREVLRAKKDANGKTFYEKYI